MLATLTEKQDPVVPLFSPMGDSKKSLNWTSAIDWAFRAGLYIAAFACAGLVFLRLVGCISLRQPLHILTSGGEEDPLFSIWRYVQDQPVYPDHTAIPFSISYFNWLFYVTYGSVAALVLKLSEADADWLPTIARCTTIAFAIAGIIIFYMLARFVGRQQTECNRTEWFAWSIVAMVGPLYGYWVFTARPDIAVVVLELSGLLFAMWYLESDRRKVLLLLTILSLYCAWAIKQTNISVVSALFIWFAARRRWKDALALALCSWSLYAVTFLAGSREYAFQILAAQSNQGFSPSLGATNLVRALIKMPFLPVGLAAACVYMTKRTDEKTGLLGTALLVSFLWACITSMKQGAADYYFLLSASLSVLFLIRVMSITAASTRLATATKGAALAAMAVQICGVVLVVAGVQGRLWPNHEHHEIRVRLSRVLDTLETPIIVLGDKYCNLPWVQRRPPHFMYSFTYDLDSAAGMKFEHGGIGGLISECYFKTIIAPHGMREFDRQGFQSYEVFDRNDHYSFWGPRTPTAAGDELSKIE